MFSILYQTFVRLSSPIFDYVHFCAHAILLQHQVAIVHLQFLSEKIKNVQNAID